MACKVYLKVFKIKVSSMPPPSKEVITHAVWSHGKEPALQRGLIDPFDLCRPLFLASYPPHPHTKCPPANPDCFQFPEHTRWSQFSHSLLFPVYEMPTCPPAHLICRRNYSFKAQSLSHKLWILCKGGEEHHSRKPRGPVSLENFSLGRWLVGLWRAIFQWAGSTRGPRAQEVTARTDGARGKRIPGFLCMTQTHTRKHTHAHSLLDSHL